MLARFKTRIADAAMLCKPIHTLTHDDGCVYYRVNFQEHYHRFAVQPTNRYSSVWCALLLLETALYRAPSPHHVYTLCGSSCGARSIRDIFETHALHICRRWMPRLVWYINSYIPSAYVKRHASLIISHLHARQGNALALRLKYV